MCILKPLQKLQLNWDAGALKQGAGKCVDRHFGWETAQGHYAAVKPK